MKIEYLGSTELEVHCWQVYNNHPVYPHIVPLLESGIEVPDEDKCNHCWGSWDEHGYDELTTDIIHPGTVIIDMAQMFDELDKLEDTHRDRYFFIDGVYFVRSSDFEVISGRIDYTRDLKYILKSEAGWISPDGKVYMVDHCQHMGIVEDLCKYELTEEQSKLYKDRTDYRRLEKLGFAKYDIFSYQDYSFLSDKPFTREQLTIIKAILYSKVGESFKINVSSVWDNYTNITKQQIDSLIDKIVFNNKKENFI